MAGFVAYLLAREIAERVYDGKLSIPAGWEIDGSFNQREVINPDGSTTIIPNGEVSLGNGLYTYAPKKSR